MAGSDVAGAGGAAMTGGGDVAGGGGAAMTGGSGTESLDDASAIPTDAQGTCSAVVEQHPIEGFQHTPICSPIVYHTHPPSSGDHYAPPYWAAYQTYTQPFLPGFWVHSLEHGGVVITYNCKDGCPDEVASAQAFIDSLPADCGDKPKRRLIMLPDPELDVRFAASAWGYTLRASCFDRNAFAAFVTDHYGQGREDICGGGFDPLTGAAGGTPLCP